MGKAEKTGGIGKSPAIEKVNKIENKMSKQTEYIEMLAFGRNEMPEEQKNIYYPYDRKPEVILWRDNSTVHITFQKTKQFLHKEKIYEAGKTVANFMRKIEPQRKMSCVYLWDRGEKEVAWFVMNMHGAIEKKHIKFVIEVDGYFSLGTITYPVDEAYKWEAVILYIFASLSESEDRNENGRI